MTQEELLRLIDQAADEGWTELDLAGLGLEELPEAIAKVSNLTKLYLYKNQITQIPDALASLCYLTKLDLSRNQIAQIPDAIAQLSHLTKLHLYENQITQIPDAIASLSDLTELDLSRNQIQQIPDAIASLSDLTELDLSRNQIQQIPDAIAFLSHLTKLYLYNNQIKQIPDGIVYLSALRELDLSGNQIKQIPDAIACLSALRELDLSGNQIKQIPDAIACLSHLRRLDLSGNQIGQIPDAIACLSHLTKLDLSNNQIAQIPDAIRSMEDLETLDLRGNPMPIPPEILEDKELHQPGDLLTILDIYFQTGDPNATEELNEAKLLIVGEGEAGKTTLANKLLNPDYELKQQEPATEGIDVMRWEFQKSDGKPFRVHLWDFGGQEIYHATHQFFLTERSLYILLVDNRRENPNLCYWLNIIELLSNASPVFLVQNEKQDRCCEINLSQLRGDFANLEKSLSTNLATNRGLELLQRALQNRITTLDHISTPIPKPWANVRHILENYSRNKTRIEVKEFYDICATQGFDKSDKPTMLSVSKYLHDLGIILHFQKDPILKHLVILRPEWATNAVYKVTDNEQVIANCGYFTQENLSEIWRDRQYQDLHDELLQLMKNFKLCYEIPNQAGQYIAPQRLPLEPPHYTWEDTDNLIVRYKYDFMPKGIITRLIVEMHRLIYRPDVDPPKSPLPRGTFEDPPKSPLPRGTFEDPPKSPLPRGTSEQQAPVPPLLRVAKGDLVWRRGNSEQQAPVPPLLRGARGDLVWRDGVILTDKYAKAEVIENYHQREIRIRVSGNLKTSLLNSIRHELQKIHAAYDNRLKYKEFIPCNCPQCKGSQHPHLYDFDALRRRLDNRRYEVECDKSYQMVNVRGLMEDFPDFSRQSPQAGISGSDRFEAVDYSSYQQTINKFYIGGNSMTQDYSQTNNLQGANLSGINASQFKDNAQVNHSQFTQNNNANTAELLQLIASMRQTAAQFPPDVRDEIIIDIEDVEAEIQKPESDRNKTRLKKRLMAITAATMAIATPIAGMTDFANNAIDLGNKLGIELSLPQ